MSLLFHSDNSPRLWIVIAGIALALGFWLWDWGEKLFEEKDAPRR